MVVVVLSCLLPELLHCFVKRREMKWDFLYVCCRYVTAPPPPHTHTHTHARTHARTHAHTPAQTLIHAHAPLMHAPRDDDDGTRDASGASSPVMESELSAMLTRRLPTIARPEEKVSQLSKAQINGFPSRQGRIKMEKERILFHTLREVSCFLMLELRGVCF